MSKTRRRRFLLSAGALLVAPFAAEAQQAGKVWRVGVIRPGPDDAVFRQNFDPFRHALREFRFTEGTNLTIEYRVRAGKPEEILALATHIEANFRPKATSSAR